MRRGAVHLREGLIGAAVLVAIAALGALASFWMNRDLPPVRLAAAGVGTIAPAGLVRLDGGKVLWVDARWEKDYESGHLPGAVCFNEMNWEAQVSALVFGWRPGVRVVVYGAKDEIRSARRMAAIISAVIGLRDVSVFRGDWKALRVSFGSEKGAS